MKIRHVAVLFLMIALAGAGGANPVVAQQVGLAGRVDFARCRGCSGCIVRGSVHKFVPIRD